LLHSILEICGHGRGRRIVKDEVQLPLRFFKIAKTVRQRTIRL
jgi:hypothetical protein